ncbi:hypothetical protein CEE36_10850 [candidate division TA06 bacterium B3_TA06]|uniref:Uncharacterized protein n=1 Tax=candidate division TA06 bacterium B3_TA06 TaxID=2012487 RepID=A0A532USU6_UNCT6|nr:MAG: hypothetical protein CEE36_10850 [candidate division TA06 bacterium B3_TA06]
MSKKTLLIIAAIAVMLVGATSAYGYYETWDSLFISGTLTYGGNDYQQTGDYYGIAYDSTVTGGTTDTFSAFIWPVALRFVSANGDTIDLSVRNFTGNKETGTSGTKEGAGTWSGSAVRYKNGVPETRWTSVSGTWDTEDQGGQTYYFDYTMCPSCPPNIPTYSARWDVTSSTPGGLNALTGDGGSSGHRRYFSPFEPQP